MTPHGHFNWNELMTRDVDAAQRFYTQTLGWHFQSVPMPDGMYHIAMQGDAMVAGMFDISGTQFQGVSATWFAYIEVDNVDARVEAAVKAGATLTRPAFDVPQTGRIAMLQQPDGAMIGWMTSEPM